MIYKGHKFGVTQFKKSYEYIEGHGGLYSNATGTDTAKHTKSGRAFTVKTILLKFRTVFTFHLNPFGLNAGFPSSKPNASHESQEKKIVAMIMSEPLPKANKVDHCKDKCGRKRKEKWFGLNNSPVPSFLRFYLIVAGKVLHPFITST
jgi:hypothetical protein